MTQTDIKKHIEEADARALATTGPHGVNCVPVSVVKVVDDTVYLYDFFMGKTVDNIVAESTVALSCWKGLCGVQIKASASYITDGDVFEKARAEMEERFPERTLSGVLALQLDTAYDISAGPEAGQEVPCE